MTLRRSVAVCCALALGASCAGGTNTRGGVPANRIVSQNLTVASGDAVRFGFSPSEPFAHALVTFEPSTAGVMLCPLTALSSPLPPIASCRTDVGSGVRETVTAPGLRGIAVVATRGAVKADLTIEFAGRSRTVAIRVPRIGAPGFSASCADVDCSPLFEVSPPGDGMFSARASWGGPPATLLLLQGRILARSFTATGLPYREVARADGASARSVTATISSTGEYALVLRQAAGAGALTDVQIDATWP